MKDAYHISKKSANFGWKSNEKVIFQKIHLEL